MNSIYNPNTYITPVSPRRFSLQTEKEIMGWLDRMGIKNYSIDKKLRVAVDGPVLLSNKKISYIPIQFSTVSGSFSCDNNSLFTLEGCPHIVGGTFYCENNHLTSLKGSPRKVIDDFYCDMNYLTSLKGAPKYVGQTFTCGENKIENLDDIDLLLGEDPDNSRFYYTDPDIKIFPGFEEFYSAEEHPKKLDTLCLTGLEWNTLMAKRKLEQTIKKTGGSNTTNIFKV